MERFAVAATQRHRANPVRIQRLPPHGELRFLRVKGCVSRRLRREDPGWQHRGSIVAVPLLAFGNIKLQTVETAEIPCRAGYRNAKFLISPPNVPVHTEALSIR